MPRLALANAYDQLQAELKSWERTYLFFLSIRPKITKKIELPKQLHIPKFNNR